MPAPQERKRPGSRAAFLRGAYATHPENAQSLRFDAKS